MNGIHSFFASSAHTAQFFSVSHLLSLESNKAVIVEKAQWSQTQT